jgi:phospholipid/cholesterol/gamma-HCH transport system substrate-binding protein
MEPNKHYLIVGSFVLAALAGLAAFLIWFSNAGDRTVYHYYQIKFRESVSGLSLGGPVKYRGVDVGSVMNIRIVPEEINTIAVRVRIGAEVPVKTNTVAQLRLQGITGVTYIELSGDGVDMPMMAGSATREGELPEIPSRFSDIATLTNKVPELLDETTGVMQRTGHLISDDNVALMGAILKKWDTMSLKLDRLVTSTDHVMQQVEQGKVNETLGNLRRFTATTEQATAHSYEELNQLLLEARQATRELRDLAQELRQNPSQIIYQPRDNRVSLP